MSQIRLTNGQRLQICKHKDENLGLSQTALAKWATKEFGLAKTLSQASISKIIKKRANLETMDPSSLNAKRQRLVQYPVLEEALALWVLQCQHRGVIITGDLICAKAQRLAESLGTPDDAITFSHGWLQKFQQRHKLRAIRIHSESGSVDVEAMNKALPDLKKVIAEHALCNIYNMDETGLCYSMTPDRTIAQQEIEGHKKNKTRISIAFTANADGSDKLQPFFIGKAKKPRCFNKKSGQALVFLYRNNTKAWMTGVFFQEWLANVDKTMKQKEILLLLDNAPSHITDGLELTNVKVQLLPPSTTSKIQPMDAGIIAAFKRRYRRYHLQNVIDCDERGEAGNIYKVDQFTAMRWSVAAWNEISATTIANCFNHTGLFSNLPVISSAVEVERNKDGAKEVEEAESELEQELRDQLEQLRVRDAMTISELLDPNEEDETAQPEMTENEILEEVKEAEEEGENSEDVAPVADKFTRTEKINLLRDACSLLDVSQESHQAAYRVLRDLQLDIRNAPTTQTTLDMWFK